MIKYFCDACGKETNTLYELKYLCHIDTYFKGSLSGVYVDEHMNRISGRPETKNMCIKCYNSVLYTALEKFNSITKIHDDE